MQKIKGKKGFMAIKIDLEKAYDRVNWDFLVDTLQEIGLDNKMIDIIWNCVATLSMHIPLLDFITLNIKMKSHILTNIKFLKT